MSFHPREAMVLAAGLGTRMKPLTDTLPKPLIEVAGKPLIDHVLDALGVAGVTHCAVNAHYKAEMLIDHLSGRTAPRVSISDERAHLMDTGGGVKKALPLLGDKTFFSYNSDFIWTEGGVPALRRMGDAWDETRMDALMLLSPQARTTGFEGPGDFFMDDDGHLSRRGDAVTAPYVWMGVQIITKSAYDNTPDDPFSNNLIWDRMIADGRLYGLEHNGIGCHVGSPDGVIAAEEVLERR